MNIENYLELHKRWVIITLSLLYLLIVFISAWLCDDSYITFRTVDNFINGHGLTWNISERVQAYTHPLWMFIISVFYFITREVYYSSIIISMFISISAVLLLLFKLSDSVINSLLTALILILSKAFIDYSTSGLENPLTHLLIVLFFVVYFSEGWFLKNKNENKKLFILTIITSFAVLNRMDTILIFLPALVASYLKTERLKGLLIAAAGFLPFLLWEIFSLFYYGFLFPNTAYAKLNTGIPQIEFIEQGLYYLVNSLYLDPLTLIVIIASLLIVLIKKDKNLLPLSIGIMLYLIYIIKIGGDFMGGRFLSAPLICSAIIISKTRFNSIKVVVLQIAVIIILGLLSPKPTIFYNQYYSLGPKIVKAFRFGPQIVNMYKGIADERSWYYEHTGLLNNIFQKKIYLHPWVTGGIKMKKQKINFVAAKGTIGFTGFYAGFGIHIIDPFALSDPLLSKLPATEYWLKKSEGKDVKKWRIGHFTRKIPAGYIETIETGENKIEDESLKKYYDKLSIIIRGELFDTQRWQEIINLNLGKYDYLIEDYEKKLLNDRQEVSK